MAFCFRVPLVGIFYVKFDNLCVVLNCCCYETAVLCCPAVVVAVVGYVELALT